MSISPSQYSWRVAGREGEGGEGGEKAFPEGEGGRALIGHGAKWEGGGRGSGLVLLIGGS